MADQGLVQETACAIVDKLKAGEVTPLDLLDVLEKRIAEVDGPVNALPTLCFDRARDRARALMKKPVGERGLLAGLPVPIKDLTAVEGVLTTQGSPIYKDNIPAKSDILVEHLEDNGGGDLRQVQHAGIRRRRQHLQRSVRRRPAIPGTRRAPPPAPRAAPRWRSPPARPGSPTAPTWAARLRNPASFCGIVGLRPSIGRVAHTLGRRDRPQSRRAGPDGAQRRGRRAAARRHERRTSRPIRCRCRCCRTRSCPPRAPATSRSASPIRPISASRRSIPKSPPSPARRRSVSPRPAPSSRKRIRICARPMNASMCCARSTSR